MSESILNSVKKLLGLAEDYTPFDQDIIMHINTAFMVLNQLGAGPSEPFHIEDAKEEWSDFVNSGGPVYAIKTYIYLKVRLVFDPPTSSFVLTSMEKAIQEYEWRINVQVDKGGISSAGT